MMTVFLITLLLVLLSLILLRMGTRLYRRRHIYKTFPVIRIESVSRLNNELNLIWVRIPQTKAGEHSVKIPCAISARTRLEPDGRGAWSGIRKIAISRRRCEFVMEEGSYYTAYKVR